MATKPKRKVGGLRNPPGGRPTKLDRELAEKCIGAVAAGNYLDVAARYAGINRETFHRWLSEGARERDRRTAGNKPDPRLDDRVWFSNAIGEAMAQAEARCVALIQQHAAGDWRAAAWHLERKHSARWGRSDRLVVEADVLDGPSGARQDQVDELLADPDGRAALDALSASVARLSGGDGGNA